MIPRGWLGVAIGVILLLPAAILAAEVSAEAKPAADSEEAVVERTIRASIGWAMDKDKQLLYDSVARDADFFIFHPDSNGTIVGFEAFQQLVDGVFMSPKFKAKDFQLKELRVHISRGGDTAWFSSLLDDHGEWDGRPTGWDNARWTGVLEKRAGKWVLVQMHFSLPADPAPAEPARKEVWDTIQAFCRTWAGEGNADGLREYFHPDIITASPDRRDRVEGRDANIQAYKDFLASTKVTGWTLRGEKILVLGRGDAAVADFEYEIPLERNGQATLATGRDTMVLVKRAGRWWIVADHFSPFPKRQTP
jgi:ketosteroid isomerase-like protein